MDYTIYRDTYGGTATEEEFNKMLPKVLSITKNYIDSLILKWDILPSLEDYDLDIDMAIANQIDFISLVGGVKALYGLSDFNVTSINTSGFTIAYDKANIATFNSVPLSPLFTTEIINQLRIKGYLYRGLC